MLDSLTVQLAIAGQGAFHWLLAPTGGLLSRPDKVVMVPGEPSTLSLALIGIGTVGVYVAAIRFLRPRRSLAMPTDRLSDQSVGAQSTTLRKEVPRRGAA